MIVFVTEVNPYAAALIGASAAVLGGVLVAGSNLLTTWSQPKYERRLQGERDERERKQAVRVVLEELSEIEKMLLRSAARQLTWKSDERQLPAGAWARYRETLAGHVSDEAWRLVAHAYHRANETNWHVIELEKEYSSGGPIHFLEKEWLRETFVVFTRPWRRLRER